MVLRVHWLLLILSIVGIGFETKLAEKLDLSGEGSLGDGGVGAKALLN